MLHICAEHAETPKKDATPNGDAAEEAPASATTEPARDAEGDVSMGGDAPSAPPMSTETPATSAAPAESTSTDAAAAPAAEVEAAEEDAAETSTTRDLKHQAIATIGIALIAMGEEVGSEMALRQFQHLVRRLSCTRLDGLR